MFVFALVLLAGVFIILQGGISKINQNNAVAFNSINQRLLLMEMKTPQPTKVATDSAVATGSAKPALFKKALRTPHPLIEPTEIPQEQ